MSLTATEYNMKFGKITTTDAGTVTFDAHKATVEDWIYRHTGLQKFSYGLLLIGLALSDSESDRKKYLGLKSASLHAIAENTSKLFNMEFTRLLSEGLPEHVIRKRANKFAREYENRLMKDHDEQFPDEFTYEQAIKLLKIERINKKNKD